MSNHILQPYHAVSKRHMLLGFVMVYHFIELKTSAAFKIRKILTFNQIRKYTGTPSFLNEDASFARTFFVFWVADGIWVVRSLSIPFYSPPILSILLRKLRTKERKLKQVGKPISSWECLYIFRVSQKQLVSENIETGLYDTRCLI